MPFDVSEGTLRDAALTLAARYPGIEVHAVVGDFEHHLARLPRAGRRMVAFLGSTIGNLEPAERARFLAELRAGTRAGRLVPARHGPGQGPGPAAAAYDDAAGVTAAFNRNVLDVLNHRLGADFQPERFGHVARWNDEHERIEMWLRSDGAQTRPHPGPGPHGALRGGRGVAHRDQLRSSARPASRPSSRQPGSTSDAWWTDAAGDFALSLVAGPMMEG